MRTGCVPDVKVTPFLSESPETKNVQQDYYALFDGDDRIVCDRGNLSLSIPSPADDQGADRCELEDSACAEHLLEPAVRQRAKRHSANLRRCHVKR
ncbi:hypothetical protein D3C77_396460 [compost metagenome]